MSAENPVFVLDSYALLAYLAGESGMERVKEILRECAAGKCRALLSLINLGEVIYIIERRGGLTKAYAALAAIDRLPLGILPAAREAVLQAAHIKVSYPIAYANAFAAAAAQMESATLVTGDPEFAALKENHRIEWLVSHS